MSDLTPFDILGPLSVDELWAVHDYVRQHDKLGQEWDRPFMAAVMVALRAVIVAPTHAASLVVTEDDLWQIDRQVPSALMVGTKPVGRELLLKVMQLIAKMRGEADDEYPGPGDNPRAEPAGDTHPAAAPG